MGNKCCGSSSAIANDDRSTTTTSFPKRGSTNVNGKVELSASRNGSLSTVDTVAKPDATSPAVANAAAVERPAKAAVPLPSLPPPSPAVAPAPPPLRGLSALGRPPMAVLGAGGAEDMDTRAPMASLPALDASRTRRRRQRTVSPRLGATMREDPFTDTFQISTTTVSDGDEEDCFSVDVSVPTHSVVLLERPTHAQTFSDVTSEMDFTAPSFDRPRAERGGRGLATRDLVAMEAERRGRILRSAQTAQRSLWNTLCREQAMHERAAMLQRFFLERLALQLWETAAREAVTRTRLLREEDAAASAIQQQCTDLLARWWARCCSQEDGLASSAPATVVKGPSQSSSQHAWDTSLPGTRATEDVDLTSSASFDDEDSGGLLRPMGRTLTPPSSLRLASPYGRSMRPGTAPAGGHQQHAFSGAGANDDLGTAGSTSLDRSTRSVHSAPRGQSPVAADPRSVVRGKHVARVGAAGHGGRAK